MYTHYFRLIAESGVIEKLEFSGAVPQRLAALEMVNRWNRMARGIFVYWIE